MNTGFPALNPTERVLMGPGPSDVSQRVLRALAAPTVETKKRVATNSKENITNVNTIKEIRRKKTDFM